MKAFNTIYLLSILIISCDTTPMVEKKKCDEIDEIIIHFQNALKSNSNELIKHDVDQTYKDSIYQFFRTNRNLIVKGNYKHLRIHNNIVMYEIKRRNYSVTSGYKKDSNFKIDSILKLYQPGDSLIAFGFINPKSIESIESINKSYASNKPNFFMEVDSVQLIKRFNRK